MNWVRELLDLYEKEEAIAGEIRFRQNRPLVLLPPFHTTVAAQITVIIDENGKFIRAERVSEEDKLTIIPVTEKSGSRTAGVEPHPFCDNLKYLCGDYMLHYNNKKKDYSKNYELYITELEKWRNSLYTHKKVNALYEYLVKQTLITDLSRAGILKLDENGVFIEKEKLNGIPQEEAFVRFCIEEIIDAEEDILNDNSGQFFSECWLDKTLQKSFIDYYKSTFHEPQLCYLTGENAQISFLHSKKIRNEGDGAKLISSNDSANFTFRGRFRNKAEAFSIGYEASQKAHNALKWIIRRQGYHFNDMCLVIWESNLKPIPDWSFDTDKICDDYDSLFEALELEELKANEVQATGEEQAERFLKAMRGYKTKLGDTSKIVLLSFNSATTGRLAMTEYKTFESARYIENIKYWHKSCEWLHKKKKDKQNYSFIGMVGIKEIAEVLYGTEQKGILTLNNKVKLYSNLCERLLPCITEKKPLPIDFVNRAVQRASSPVSFEEYYNWERALSLACSFVKKQKIDEMERRRKAMDLEKEELQQSVQTEYDIRKVDEECGDRSYLYGRLLAVADRIEYTTFDREEDKNRVTNAKRFMCAFSQNPYRTWQTIEENVQNYLNKKKVSERMYYSQLLDKITAKFNREEFIKNEKLDGLYLLGFHCQSYDMTHRAKAEDKKEKEEEENKND